jgi:DNA-binding CsgD family transcriptional regulator
MAPSDGPLKMAGCRGKAAGVRGLCLWGQQWARLVSSGRQKYWPNGSVGPCRQSAEGRESHPSELRATGARPRRVVLTGLDSLTASEGRIAELARQGLSNREIAQMLFITTRTVEGHLTSVFRKLRVDSRDELPAALVSGV